MFASIAGLAERGEAPSELAFSWLEQRPLVEHCCDSTARLFRLASADSVVGFKKALCSGSNLRATSDEPECHQTEFLTPKDRVRG